MLTLLLDKHSTTLYSPQTLTFWSSMKPTVAPPSTRKAAFGPVALRPPLGLRTVLAGIAQPYSPQIQASDGNTCRQYFRMWYYVAVKSA